MKNMFFTWWGFHIHVRLPQGTLTSKSEQFQYTEMEGRVQNHEYSEISTSKGFEHIL